MAKKKKSEDEDNSKSIADKTQAFIDAGGVIKKIDKGTTGLTSTKGPKHINLSD